MSNNSYTSKSDWNSRSAIGSLLIFVYVVLAAGLLILGLWQPNPPLKLVSVSIAPTSMPPLSSPPEATPTVAPGSYGITPSVAPSSTVQSTYPGIPNLADLQQYMLQLINESRTSNNLSAVEWDVFAADIGQAHAEEMAANAYLSHWDLAGFGPDIRYSLAGGTDLVMENVYSFWQRYDNGTPVPIQDWKEEVRKAQNALMNSPGHRANILMPEHTQVGVGIAYDPSTGEFRIAQEFLNHYIELQSSSQTAQPGDIVRISGMLLAGCTDPLINTFYESTPVPMNVAALNQTSTYASPANFLAVIPAQVNADGTFTADIPFGQQVGMYHIRIWAKCSGLDLQAIDAVIWVGVNP